MLKHAGGFQFLLSKEGSRKQLQVMSYGSCDAEQLRCFGTGRVYVRPLQKSIPLTDDTNSCVEYEECLFCNLSVSVKDMQKHCEDCHVRYFSSLYKSIIRPIAHEKPS
jgi:hypothetical protein